MVTEDQNQEPPLKKWIEDIVEAIHNELRQKEPGKPMFSDPRYFPKELTAENVHTFDRSSPNNRKIAFVDGGNRNLLVTPTFCVGLVRVYFNLFQGIKRLKVEEIPQKIDFYLFVTAKKEDGDIHYHTGLFPKEKAYERMLPNEQDLNLNSWDRTIMAGNKRAPIERVASATRRFAEWKLAKEATLQVLDEGDIIVRDGTLQTTVTNEANYAENLYEKAKQKKVTVTGVSKTSRLYTDSGNSLVTVIRRLGEQHYPAKRWYYYPVVVIEHPDHQAELFYVKFHPQAEYVFRFEIYREQAREMSQVEKESILAMLADNARDITFPGYPYGLIDADRFSRIRSDEVDHHIAMLKAEASKNGRWDRLKQYLQSTNAHEKLNEVVGL